MKAKRRYERKHSPEVAKAIGMRNLRPPWKKGQSGNPTGKQGSGSIVQFLKRRLRGKPLDAQEYETLADELAGKLLKMAQEGKIAALTVILDKAESRAITQEEMTREIERFYSIVTRHVSDEAALSAIARDLNLDSDQENDE